MGSDFEQLMLWLHPLIDMHHTVDHFSNVSQARCKLWPWSTAIYIFSRGRTLRYEKLKQAEAIASKSFRAFCSFECLKMVEVIKL